MKTQTPENKQINILWRVSFWNESRPKEWAHYKQIITQKDNTPRSGKERFKAGNGNGAAETDGVVSDTDVNDDYGYSEKAAMVMMTPHLVDHWDDIWTNEMRKKAM